MMIWAFLTGVSVAMGATTLPPQKVVNAISAQLKSVVSETIDEGSWSASLKSLNCVQRPTHRGPLVVCTAKFRLSVYDRSEIDADPWTTSCGGLLYFYSQTTTGKVKIENYKETEQSCLELLSESPF